MEEILFHREWIYVNCPDVVKNQDMVDQYLEELNFPNFLKLFVFYKDKEGNKKVIVKE